MQNGRRAATFEALERLRLSRIGRIGLPKRARCLMRKRPYWQDLCERVFAANDGAAVGEIAMLLRVTESEDACVCAA